MSELQLEKAYDFQISYHEHMKRLEKLTLCEMHCLLIHFLKDSHLTDPYQGGMGGGFRLVSRLKSASKQPRRAQFDGSVARLNVASASPLRIRGLLSCPLGGYKT